MKIKDQELLCILKGGFGASVLIFGFLNLHNISALTVMVLTLVLFAWQIGRISYHLHHLVKLTRTS